MKVAFVIQTFHPVVGGSERQLLALLPELMSRGVEPCVITRGLAGKAKAETLDGIPVFRCGSTRYGALGSLFFLLEALVQLRRFDPKVVHVFSLMTPASIGMLFRVCCGAPLVLKALRGGRRGDLDRIRHKPLFHWRCRQLSRQIDAAQVISDEIDSEFATIGVPASRRYRIRNGVDIDAVTFTNDSDLRRTLECQAGDATVFVYVGRLVAEKRIDLLIEAFEAVARHFADVRLWIIGDGPERVRVASMAARDSRIVRFGEVSNVPAYLAVASVFVQPSSTEGMSNSLLEAMASGNAVIATDVGAARELLGLNERGWLVTPNDCKALQRAMIDVLEDPTRELRAQRGQAHVAEHFSLASTADALTTLYQSLVVEPRLVS